MQRLRWWHFGLIGGFVISYATAVKIVRALKKGQEVDIEWGELAGFAAALFGMGFICGVIVWAGRRLHARIGAAGDALIGLAVLPTFFISCMLAFAPEMFNEKLGGGIAMLAASLVFGPLIGAWFGRDMRKAAAPPKVATPKYRAPSRPTRSDDNPFEP